MAEEVEYEDGPNDQGEMFQRPYVFTFSSGRSSSGAGAGRNLTGQRKARRLHARSLP